MKKISIPLAIAGALLGFALVVIFKPNSQEVGKNSSTMPIMKPEMKSTRSIEAVIKSFRLSESAAERLRITEEFRGFNSDDFKEALAQSGHPGEDWRANQAVRCLLIAWAEKAPRAVMEWSWSHFKNGSKWESAFDEVIQTWVSNDPVSVIAFFHETRKSDDEATMKQVEESESIILDETTLEQLRQTFFANNSTTALLAIQEGLGLPVGVFPRRLDFSDLLNTKEEVEAAQEMWKDVEGADLAKSSLANRLAELTPAQPMNAHEDRPAQIPAYQGLELPSNSKRGPVLQRLDRQRLAWSGARVDFKRTVVEAQLLDAGEQEAVFLAMYDSWHLAHPGKEPDLTLLPEEAQKLWQDLDGLGPLEDSFSSSQWSSEEFQKE